MHPARQLLDCLFGEYFKNHGRYIEFRLLKNEKAKQWFFGSLDEALSDRVFRELERLNGEGWNIYFGASPRLRKSGKKEDVGHVVSLWADLDAKDYSGGKEEAFKRLTEFPITPSAIVDTGHGFHVYWFLAMMVPVDSAIDLTVVDRIEGLMRGINHTLGADHVQDLSRILRLPGFVNMKELTAPAPCVLLEEHFKPERRYTLEDFAAYATVAPPKAAPVNFNIDESVQVPEKFSKLLNEDKKLADTWYGRRTLPHDNSRSGYDMSLASQLKKHGFDPKEIAAVLKHAPSGKGPDASPQYLQHTVGKAYSDSGAIPAETPKKKSISALEETQATLIAKQIVNLILEGRPMLVHDEIDTPFALIVVNGHQETHPIRSSRFKQWVIRQYWNKTKKPPRSEHIKQALDLLESLASLDGEKVRLANRTAEHDHAIWYDLSDEEWRAVKVTGTGWEVVENPPMIFQRRKHQSAQVLPIKGGALSTLLDYMNLADEQQRLLLQVYVVSCFVPNIPHPIPVLYGAQGSTKSTFLRVIRRLVDPSATELLTFPTRMEELIQQLSHHWAPFYDNVTSIPDWLSDALCRAVTGEGFSKRALYSNDEDFIYSFRCCVGINGINIAAQRADLLDRSILFGLDRISAEKRKDEQIFWNNFEQNRPAILGAVFDVLSKAMAFRPTLKLKRLPRMADFAIWGSAIAQALGYSPEEFLNAYTENITQQNEEAIHEHPVATVLCVLMDQRDEWSGTSTELLEILERLAVEGRISIKQELWPKAPHALSRRLNEVKTNLENIGITIQSTRGSRRTITIIRSRNTVNTVEPSDNVAPDAPDGISAKSKRP